MFIGVDHVVVAVRDIEAAVSGYKAIYGMKVTSRAEETATSMKMAFFRFADTYTVLVSSSDATGRIAAWIKERGENVWHAGAFFEEVRAVATATHEGLRA